MQFNEEQVVDILLQSTYLGKVIIVNREYYQFDYDGELIWIQCSRYQLFLILKVLPFLKRMVEKLETLKLWADGKKERLNSSNRG